MAKRKSIIPGFSWNRAIGITSAKQKIARATGIPTTKQGRKRKLQSSLWTAVAFGAAASHTKKSSSPLPPAEHEHTEPLSASHECDSTAVPQTQKPRSLVYAEQGDMFAAAVYAVFEMNRAEVSVLQRKLKIGYSQAAKLMDEMYARGIVGEFNGSKPREILISQEQFEESLNQ